MRTGRRRWSWITLAILVAVLLTGYALLGTAAAPAGDFRIDPVALHDAAAQGPLPERIEVERVGTFAFPRTLVVAGDGLRLHPMILLAHRVVWPDGRSVIIDTALGPAGAKKLPGSRLDPMAFDRVQAGMKKASAIVFTHEHVDHVGGVASAADGAAIAKQVMMTSDQLGSPRLERADFAPGALEHLQPLAYEGLHAIAPGVVLQKAPGHSPGSQVIYVELANGARFLFVGDIAWTHDNITMQRGRPFLAKLLMGEDRPGVAAQLRALAALPPDIHVIVAHDPIALARDLAAGLFRQGWSGF